MTNIVAQTRQRCPELADYFEDCCEQPFAFNGDDPNTHSADNHIHLFSLVAHKDDHAWIDPSYMTAFATHIFARWRARLRGMMPYQQQGYRLYLYQDFAPTISVVAESPTGFPYGGSATFVEAPADIMMLYRDYSFAEMFHAEPITDDAILNAIDSNKGSISKPTANALGVSVGILRRLIENWDIQDQVNAIRKRYRRRPARFRTEYELPFRFKIYEERLPANYK